MSPTDLAIADIVRQVRNGAGFAVLPDWGLIEVSGPDAASFLQSQTTNDILALSVGQGQLTALLDRKAHVDAILSLHRIGETRFWLIAEGRQIPAILKRLERYHFSEKLTMADLSTTFGIFTLQGPQAWKQLEAQFPHEIAPLTEGDIREGLELNAEPVTLIKRTMTGEEGFLLISSNDLVPFLGQMPETPRIPTEALNILRVEAGLPRYGVDISPEVMLPSTGLQHTTVSYTKGCYLGQEVVAKVKTHGSIQKALVGFAFTELTNPIACPVEIKIGDSTVGQLTSSVYSPTLDSVIALGYLNRENRVPDKVLQLDINRQSHAAKVVMLPFYTPTSATERARELYDTAVKQFAHNEESEAISNLREALERDPHLTDAYEALGVILSRREQYDEAIALMEKWAELAPDEGMPHTNLSVFYMKIGMKEKAEEEKAIATTLGFKKAMAEKMQQQSQAQAEQAQRQALEGKVAMFREVLELDAEDTLANYGLGNTYVSLGEFQQAIPHLEKALANDPKYTVAYLALGKALAGLEEKDKARAVFEQGIAVASQRGDLMPLNEMQSRLAQL